MKNVFSLLCLLIVSYIHAQDYRFGKISKEELSETSNAKAPEAHATILYVNEEVFFQYTENEGFTVVKEVQKRIKIYDKEGVDWATEHVPFYDNGSSNVENLSELKGYTYYLKDGKVEKDKLDKDNVFREQTNQYWGQLKFTMPNITDGCIVEFKYRKESPFIALDDVDFQYDIPVKKLEFNARIPEYFYFNKYLNPKAKYVAKITESQRNRVENVNSKQRSGGAGFSNTQTSFDSSKWEFKETEYMADLEDIPALVEEPFVDNMDMYRATAKWEYAMYKGPDNSIKNYSTDWESVIKTIYDHSSFGGQLSKSNYFEKDLDALLANVTSNTERISLIYNFVKSKVAWNEFYGDYAENGVKKAYKDGTGNVGDINLMLTAMLRYAGLNANPVLISTKSNGIPLYPTRNGFNYIISAIEVPNDVILLDATDRYALPNVLPSRAINWQGRIVREQGSSAWVDLLHPVSEDEKTTLQYKINPDLSAEGRVYVKLSNSAAMKFRSKYDNMGDDERLRDLEEDKGEIEISNYKIKNEDDLNSPTVDYSYTYVLKNAVESIGDKLYVSPMLFYATTENIFKQEKRNYSLEFTYPKDYHYTVSIMLPEGYTVESMPESTKVQFNGNEGTFSFLVSQSANMVLIKSSFQINSTFVLPSDYDQFKQFFGMLVEKETEKMVLVKSELKGTE
ncbi:DUF3857 domain-containing protein [Formosa algae]|uniref:DUF3857 domain-containing protein n=1 Tax=Formosa algae TaxID=225843 RepID=A0A9X1CAM1_9FLAO|nr:DUF3857 domain-containing protein [Formosa algae]MBP1838234.1 hypothetical protein [Formosa algae]MDQ0334369.1 hypothetical protein [Formosa algae]OEI80686.1 hypothetical protein AST99_07680 [Formosa algae]